MCEEVYSQDTKACISQEFSRLKGHTYLDHAASTLYSTKQLEETCANFSTAIFTNPHGTNTLSKSTDDAVDVIRYQVLKHFNTTPEDYSIIFTSGATQSLKTVAEYFDYGMNEPSSNSKGVLAYLEDNHTSVLGMRAYTDNYRNIKLEDAFEALNQTISSDDCFEKQKNMSSNSLFVYPPQSNFAGTKYPLSWIEAVRKNKLNSILNVDHTKWYVLLDCASFVGTNPLDLSKYQPDFVTISFYKMFGYPSGLGALLVRNDVAAVLKKTYFGGGTVLMALSTEHVMIPKKSLSASFEDGSLPFLSILALRYGFNLLQRLNINFELISKHTFSLAKYVYKRLLELHHGNGAPVAVLYHDTTFEDINHQGGIVNFNLLRSDGQFIGYSEVSHICNLHGIYVRTGCSCNPGACHRMLNLSSNDVINHFKAGHSCGDQYDLIQGRPTGSVRISFGYMSMREDADYFLTIIGNSFVSKPIVRKLPETFADTNLLNQNMFCRKESTNTVILRDELKNGSLKQEERIAWKNEICQKGDNNNDYEYGKVHVKGKLNHIFVYPVKSCGALSVTKRWRLTPTGLEYDRQWMIVNSSGVCVSQKNNCNLCLIKPFIDLKRNVLTLKYKDTDTISVPLSIISNVEKGQSRLCQSKICGDKIQAWDCGNEVGSWLSKHLGMNGLRLLRLCEENGRQSKNTQQLSMANKAQYLLVNTASVKWLTNKIPINEQTESEFSIMQRFRPNLVVNFEEPFIENNLTICQINKCAFKAGGKCTRCQMICINQLTGVRTKEPLVTLSREFQGKLSFGIYLSQISNQHKGTIDIDMDVLAY